MENHREKQDYHLKQYVESVDHLGNFPPLKDYPQHKTALTLGQGVFFETVLILLHRQGGKVCGGGAPEIVSLA